MVLEGAIMFKKNRKKLKKDNMPRNPELTITRQTDLAFLHKEFGIEALIDYGADELMDQGDEIWETFDLYLELVIAQGKQFEKAIVGDNPDDWKEANPA